MEIVPYSNGNINKDVEIFNRVRKSVLIRDSTSEELSDVLKIVMIKVGIRAKNLPEPEEALILKDHIIRNYGNMPLLSIRAAWELLIDGKIQGPEHFENFSCHYFSKVMNAYKAWENKVYRDIPVPELPKLPPVEISIEELIENAKSLWNATKEYLYMPERLYFHFNIQHDNEEEVEEAKIEIRNVIRKKLNDNPNYLDGISYEFLFDRMMKGYFVVKQLNKL